MQSHGHNFQRQTIQISQMENLRFVSNDSQVLAVFDINSKYLVTVFRIHLNYLE